MNIQENISLKEYTTFRIGGPARFFIVVKNIVDLTDALVFAQEKKLPIFILGGGSNILMSDNGFDGLVIKNEIKGISFEEKKDNPEVPEGTTLVVAGAGEDWDQFVGLTVEKNLFGLETLSLIPGTVGAAPVQNIGAYGSEVKTSVRFVEAMHIDTGELCIFTNAQCDFTYRHSFFKTEEGRKFVITRVGFLLKQHDTPNVSYRDIQKYIEENKLTETDVTLQKVREIVIHIRTNKLPSVKDYGTAGSFFKNPIISRIQYEELLAKYPGLPGFSTGSSSAKAMEDEIKIPAAWILDNVCGFKGYREGDVGVYKNQALVLVNYGNATEQDIKSLAEKMIACVKEKTNINLEREVEYI
jgi:UDP-N-acetylmuramate dehydrogenase